MHVVSDATNYFASQGGSGTAAGVTSFSGDGNLITNSSSTGAVTATLHTAGAHTWWGNNTGSTAAPGYQSIGTGDLPAIPLSGLATQAGDTMVANMTASSAVPTAVAMPTTAHGVWLAEGTATAPAATAAGTAHQVLASGGASADGAYADLRDVKIIPAANCNNATAGAGWDIPASNAPTVACRAGTNNLGGVLQWANNNTTTNAQFSFELPADWDTANQPFIAIYYGSGANTSGTVKWTFSSACSKQDGSVSDDAAFNAESASTGKTMAVANRMWAESVQFTALTSGNNCIAGSNVVVKVTSGNGTAASTVNVSKVVLTIPTQPNAAQAN